MTKPDSFADCGKFDAEIDQELALQKFTTAELEEEEQGWTGSPLASGAGRPGCIRGMLRLFEAAGL